MQLITDIITRHLKMILLFMLIVGIAFVIFLSGDTPGFRAYILAWSSFVLLIALSLGRINNILQKNVQKAIKVQAQLNIDFAELEKSADSLQAFKDAFQATMDPAVVQLIIANKLRTEKRPISVQFTDLQGFTSYAEKKSAEVLISELNVYLKKMEIVLLNYQAHIDKYMGDGIMSEFGAPNMFIKHSLLAVASGLKMQESMTQNNFPWRLRVGIATGVSTIGIIGTQRQTYTAFGDSVNLASRIEGLCEPGRVTVDETTYQECKQYFDFSQKTLSNNQHPEDEELIRAINETLTELEQNQDQPELLMKLASLMTEADDTQKALDYLNKAMTLAPDDDKIKLAYADASLKHNAHTKLEVRGRQKPVQVYELIGLKDPLGTFKNVPKELYLQEKDTIESLVSFPEDLILPVECLDGSIGQARLVGIVSYLLALKLQLPAEAKKDILEAGYLADIGKSAVPESILNRPGQLTDEEASAIHKHPAESVRKLLELDYDNQNLLSIIASHHESLNGLGYPEGISGDAIPLGSRIIAVAEAYVSMTSNRPYRDAWQVKPAFQEIVKYTGLQKFDSDVTEALGEIIKELE